MRWETVVIGLLAGAVAGLVLGRWGRGGDGGGGKELDRRLAGISDSLDRRLVDLDRRLYLGLDSVQDAQARAADTAAQVRERVAVVAGVAEQVLEQARGLSRLEDLLRPPQARGAARGAAAGAAPGPGAAPQRLPDPARVPLRGQGGRGAGGRRGDGRGRLQVPAGGVRPHEHEPRGRRGQGAAPAGLHPRRPPARRRHRRQVHLPRRGHLRLRPLLPAVGGGVLRVPARGPAGGLLLAVRGRAAGLPGLADDPVRLPGLGRGRAQGAAGRGERPPGAGRPGRPARRPGRVPHPFRAGRPPSRPGQGPLAGRRPPPRPLRRPPGRGRRPGHRPGPAGCRRRRWSGETGLTGTG